MFTTSSRFVRLSDDLLLEYIYRGGGFLAEGYQIARRNGTGDFFFAQAQTSNGVITATFNDFSRQVAPDPVAPQTWVAATAAGPGWSVRPYAGGSVEIPYDRVRLHLATTYNLARQRGGIIRIGTPLRGGADFLYLTHQYLVEGGLLNRITGNPAPFLLNGKQYNRVVEFSLPNVYFLSLQLTGGAPTIESMHERLTSGIGIQENPAIHIGFGEIDSRGRQTSGFPRIIALDHNFIIPAFDEYASLGLRVSESSQGDYFEIEGTYDGSSGGFIDFLTRLRQQRQRSFVSYEVSLTEGGATGEAIPFFRYEDAFLPVLYRPIIRRNTGTVLLNVQMKITTYDEINTILRSTNLALTADQIAKYGNRIMQLQCQPLLKPKVYQGAPSQIIMTGEQGFTPATLTTRTIPVVYTPPSGVTLDERPLLPLYPFDHYYKLSLGDLRGRTGEPFILPSGGTLRLHISTRSGVETFERQNPSTESDQGAQGGIYFFIPKPQALRLRSDNPTRFYITLLVAEVETVVATGEIEIA